MELKTFASATYQDLQLIGYLVSKKNKLYIIGTLSNGMHGTFPSSKLKNIVKLNFNAKPKIKLSDEVSIENSPESVWLKEIIKNINK